MGKKNCKKNLLYLQQLEGFQEAQKHLTGDNGDPFPGDANNTTFDDNQLQTADRLIINIPAYL